MARDGEAAGGPIVAGDTASSTSSSPASGGEARAAFAARCDAIEEAYEFLLAYAAQGLPHEQGSTAGSQVRMFLGKCERSLDGLAEAAALAVRELAPGPTDPYEAFVSVLEHDARNAGAAVRLVLAQPSIGSQLVDNLNASSHLRALLTDLFLLDEALKR
jgi:hypothetical protein